MDKAGALNKQSAISASTAALLRGGAVGADEKDYGAAIMTALRGQAKALAAHLNVSLESGPLATRKDDLLFVGMAPDSWLVLNQHGEPDWSQQWAKHVLGVASVVDVSSAYAIFRLHGGAAREILQKGLSIDLHPDAFPPGRAAVSLIAQIDVIVWTDPVDGALHVAVFRSLAESFGAWLNTAVEGLNPAPLTKTTD